jgi:pimeloyl-ACP methyl ester carboxylesterase
MTAVEPFRVELPEAAIADLRDRLARTRWSDRETVEDWSQGVPLAYIQELCAYWADGYDFDAARERFNAWPQFRVAVDGLGIHAINVRSPHADALPLVLTHGWPGSVVEFFDVIESLTEPADPADAFHVVVPSLPGYGFSDKPTTPGWDTNRTAVAWAQLMERLGYDRYGAQGGDWGALVTSALAANPPEGLVGIHLNLAVAPPVLEELGEPSPEEQAALDATEHYRRFEAGYSTQQSTRPQTLGYGLADSPAAQCAWIVEKFWSWTDCDGHPENIFTKDQLLDNVMYYWLPAAGTSSARMYWESFQSLGQRQPVDIPTGISLFPKEISRTTEHWAARRYRDLRSFTRPPRGGHFAAFEQPVLFVEAVRAFFRLVR